MNLPFEFIISFYFEPILTGKLESMDAIGQAAKIATQVIQSADPFTSPATQSTSTADADVMNQVGTTGSQTSEAGVATLHETSSVDPYVVPVAPTLGATDTYQSCSMKVGMQNDNLSKLVYLKKMDWSSSHNRWHLLGHFDPIYEMLSSNYFPATGQMSYFQYIRCGFKIKMSVAAPLGYAGGVLMVWAPPGYVSYVIETTKYDTSTLFNLPYAYLSIGDQTTVTMTVPYISDKNYHEIVKASNANNGPGSVCVFVLSPMLRPSSGRNTLEVAFHAGLIQPDFQCPRKWAAQGPEKSSTSVKTPDSCGVANPVRLPAKDGQLFHPLKAVRVQHGADGICSTDEDMFRNAVSAGIQDDITGVDYATAGSHGEIKSVLDVTSRWSYIADFRFGENNNVETRILSKLITFTMNSNFQLLKFFQQWRGTLQFKMVFFAPKSVQAKVQMSWFRAEQEYTMTEARNAYQITSDVHGPSAVLSVPFTNRTWKASTDQHYGRLSIHIVNPMTSNSTSANLVIGMVFARTAEDFKVYCPVSANQYWNYGASEELDDVKPQNFINFEPFKGHIHTSDHSLLNNLLIRPFWLGDITNASAVQKHAMEVPKDNLISLLRCGAYWTGEMVLTIRSSELGPVTVSHSFDSLPRSHPRIQDLFSSGAMYLPPSKFKSMRIPFYNLEPFRLTNDPESLGILYVLGRFGCQIFLSFTDVHLFYALPIAHFRQADTFLLPGVEDLYDPDGGWEPDLTEDGDVESNPGPLQLVCKDRGVYKHYALTDGTTLWQVDSENICATILKGTVGVTSQDFNPEEWEVASEEIQTLAEEYVKFGAMPSFQFSVDNNCETWAKEILGDSTDTQGSKLKYALVGLVALGFYATATTFSDETGVGTKIMSFLTTLQELIFSKVECMIVRTVVRTVVRIICYLILYCHAPNLITTATVGALLALDCIGPEIDPKIKKIIDFLAKGDFKALCKSMIDQVDNDPEERAILLEDNDLEWQGEPVLMFGDEGPPTTSPKPFNEWTLAFKNIQWWFESIVKAFAWIRNKIFPPKATEDVIWLEENQSRIATTMALCDEHICMMMTDKSYVVKPETREKHQVLCDTLSEISIKLAENVRITPLTSKLQALQAKMQSLSFEPNTDWQMRPEPLGVWISGAAGCGKSFLAGLIAKRVAKHYGWKTYPHPTGSNHMDGYTSQEIHYFDDFGQDREEEDYKLICQLISSSPFIIPKADVSSKGTYYNSKLVIITTNRHDFSSSKLYDPEALGRRFPCRIHLRVKNHCSTNGRLDVGLAIRQNLIEDGKCWQRNLRAYSAVNSSESWADFSLDTLIKEIVSEIDARAQTVQYFNQGPFDKILSEIEDKEPCFDFEQLERRARALLFKPPPKTKVERFLAIVQHCISRLKKFLERNRAWILGIGALASCISMCAVVIPGLKAKQKTDQNVYSGGAPVKLTKNYKVEVKHENQGPVDFYNVARRLVNVASGPNYATAIALGGKKVLTYAHDSFQKLIYTNKALESDVTKAYRVTYNDCSTDLQILEFEKLDTQFKHIGNLVHDENYSGDGYLLWKQKETFYVQPVRNIRPYQGMVTKEGSASEYCYIYDAKTGKGSCGGVLCALINGNPKILGVHTSGNGISGCANRVLMHSDEGVSKVVKTSAKPLYHQPRRSAYHKNPLYMDSGVEPAVLSKHDPRLAEPVEDVTKLAASKYCGNTFDPPPRPYNAAFAKVGAQLHAVVEKSGTISYEIASSTELLPIDWTTSPGLKYQGKSKRELVQDLKFREDCEEQLVSPHTVFTTYLKDELRPSEKVKAGKTRAIEAASFDYTIGYRMVMGKIYHQIYEDREARCGIAVGMNPYVDFHGFYSQCKEWVVCLDFKGFDGSLPPQLMRSAVEILASFHTNPDLVRRIHEPTIVSHQLVSNELWETNGGMCSGSPCTTVLNSVCNNIAAWTVMLSCGADYDDLYICSYGDDLVVSSGKKFPLENVQLFYQQFFGMTATAADKTDNLQWKPKHNLTFLKRTPKVVQEIGTQVVGVLDLKNMMDKIQWTKGSHFQEQLDSFCLELVLHGEAVYNDTEKLFKSRYPNLRMMPYAIALAHMKDIAYSNQGKSTEGPLVEGWEAKSVQQAADNATLLHMVAQDEKEDYQLALVQAKMEKTYGPLDKLVAVESLDDKADEILAGMSDQGLGDRILLDIIDFMRSHDVECCFQKHFYRFLHQKFVQRKMREWSALTGKPCNPDIIATALSLVMENQGFDPTNAILSREPKSEIQKDYEAALLYTLADSGNLAERVAVNMYVFKKSFVDSSTKYDNFPLIWPGEGDSDPVELRVQSLLEHNMDRSQLE